MQPLVVSHCESLLGNQNGRTEVLAWPSIIKMKEGDS